MAINRKLVNWSRTIHIYLSIALLIMLVFFSITGITLNHTEFFSSEPEVTEIFIDELPLFALSENGFIVDSPEFQSYLRNEFGVSLQQTSITDDGDFLLVDYRAPGLTIFIEFDLIQMQAAGEIIDYGLIAKLNDLHKARDTETLWIWLLDIASILLVIFSLAGLVLLLPNTYRLKRVAGYTVVAGVLISIGYWLGTL